MCVCACVCVFILKLSTPSILAGSHFFLFCLNAHNMLNTYIYLSPVTSYIFRCPLRHLQG